MEGSKQKLAQLNQQIFGNRFYIRSLKPNGRLKSNLKSNGSETIEIDSDRMLLQLKNIKSLSKDSFIRKCKYIESDKKPSSRDNQKSKWMEKKVGLNDSIDLENNQCIQEKLRKIKLIQSIIKLKR